MESLYACLFTNGHIKVGRSVDARARVRQHADRLGVVGVRVRVWEQFPCEDSPAAREAILIKRCASEGQQYRNEWFSGLDFSDVLEWAREAAACQMEPQVWQEIFDRPGFQSKVAGVCGVSIQAVNNWRRRGIPIEFCARVEKECSGEFTRRDFRPNDFHLIWPELA